MFRCEFCGKKVPPRTPCHMITTAKRWHRHPERSKVNKLYCIVEGRRKKIFVDDPGGSGYQIAQESRACPDCALKKNKENSDGR